MHGHHFWVLGHGYGVYNETANRTSLNVVNPPYRDSFTIFKNGWSVIRFKVCLHAMKHCSMPAHRTVRCVIAGHLVRLLSTQYTAYVVRDAFWHNSTIPVLSCGQRHLRR